MNILIHKKDNGKIAEIISDDILIKDSEDALNLIYETGELDAGKIIIYENQISPSFFDLKSGLAGEILQKFSNYRLQLAIIGDFSEFKSKKSSGFYP